MDSVHVGSKPIILCFLAGKPRAPTMASMRIAEKVSKKDATASPREEASRDTHATSELTGSQSLSAYHADIVPQGAKWTNAADIFFSRAFSSGAS